MSASDEQEATNTDEQQATNADEQQATNAIEQLVTNVDEQQATNANEHEATNANEHEATNADEQQQATNADEQQATNADEQATSVAEQEAANLDKPEATHADEHESTNADELEATDTNEQAARVDEQETTIVDEQETTNADEQEQGEATDIDQELTTTSKISVKGEEETQPEQETEKLRSSIELELSKYLLDAEEPEEGFMGEEIEEEEVFVSIFEILDAPRFLPEPVDLTRDHLKQVSKELGLITLCWPDVQQPSFEGRVNFPESYLKNTNKEKLLLLYAESFRRQFHYKYPSRKPLFLAADNECEQQKMVCTTLRPTQLPHTEIEDWKDLAAFVGDLLVYEPLETPTLIPNRLYPPHTVFLRGSGQSYEFATALCSLLLGLSYDAYVVSGYAVRDITLKIMTRVNSPFPEEDQEKEVAVVEEVDPKYVLKPPRDLHSKFLAYMEQREIDKAKAEIQRQEEEKLKELQELEKPPFDDLHGLRVHAWVLIRAGKKDIDTSFFIEPNTGYAYPLDTANYCGIESIWNHENYWVNLQDCSNGIANLDYDFTIVSNWEHLLAGEPIQTREIKNAAEMDDDELQLTMTYEEKHLDMPHPWSSPIDIPHNVIQKRFPNGMRQTWYRCALVDEYAPYIQPDGLVTRICRYRDFDCSPDTLYVIEERYENRHDHLTKIIHRIEGGYITEYFSRGREDAVKEHSYYLDNNKVEAERTIDFYHASRFDCLSKLELNAELMREYYIGRSDFFKYREVMYAKRGHPPPGILEGPRRIVLELLEKFDRNPAKQASDDIASRKFSIISKDIDLKFHYDSGKVTASTRHFVKPSLGEMDNRFTFNPEMTWGYQAEVGAKPPRQLNLFFLLEQQIKEEEESLRQVREMDDLIAEFIRLRDLERAIPKLDVSIFHREQNLEYRQGMLEREQQQKEHREREVEEETNFLNPYLAKLNLPFILTQAQAIQVREDCLNDFKQMLLNRANDIQHRYEELTLEIQRQYEWYTSALETLTLAEEEQYFKQLNQNNFQLHIYEMRLARHRDLSGYRYKALEEYLNHHPALIALNAAEE